MKKVIVITMVFIISVTIYLSARETKSEASYIASTRKFDDGVKITLILDGKTFDLQSYNMSFYAPTADKISPLGAYQVSSVNIGIRTAKIDQELLNWILAIDPKLKDGQIIVYDGDTNKVIRKIVLTGLRTASYSENNSPSYNTNSQLTNLNLKYQTVSIKL